MRPEAPPIDRANVADRSHEGRILAAAPPIVRHLWPIDRRAGNNLGRGSADRSWLPADRSPLLPIDRHTAPIDRQTARKPPHERFLRNFGCNFLLFSLLGV